MRTQASSFETRTHRFRRLSRRESLGSFSWRTSPDGVYTVDAWHKYFERASQPDIVITPGSAKHVNFNLDICGMHHLDPRQKNFATRTEVRAGSEFERDLASKARLLPCRADQNASSPMARNPPRCANLSTMGYYAGLLEKNKAGYIPKNGEGPVLSGAYFGAIVEFDQASRLWRVKLRLEYNVACESLCGEGVVYDRWGFFDQSGTVTKVDDDCGCHTESVS